MNEVLFLGCTRKLRADWQTIVSEIAVPKNLKDQVKIQEARDAAIADLINVPVLSYHDEIVLLFRDGTIAFEAKAGAIKTEIKLPIEVAGTTDAALLAVLAATYPSGLTFPHTGPHPQRLFGIDIKEELRIAAMAAGPNLRNICSYEHWRMPSQGQTAVLDPYEYAIPSENRRQITPAALCAGFGIASPDLTTARGRAMAAMNIARAMGLGLA